MSSEVPFDLEIDLAVEAGDWPPQDQLTGLLERAVSAAVAEAGLKAVPGSEISFVLTDDEAVRQLNKRWREKDKPTNVLSFPGSDPEGDLYGPLLGDIVIASQTVIREAEELGIEFSDHLSHLVVHGMLHLFDYDHQDSEEAELMESLEKAILAKLGIDDPYADRPLVADYD
ncbi:rRNA maturation RNase YbeY [Roseibium denhamense]|uniref:Endoribonuclease YbeY n=1 Tax=Roseibium denhamense TaxID=76305 RepID=A0ABY1PP48_9HYPH|nr:rRNA maturation RNase YbeY [Roseibium denhamense]MTI06936.1 rRNA maturation RNase YbeY [Roseibium denhamense]SMP36731.1 probable rRNA maturation factor [Roseibium denhamense]